MCQRPQPHVTAKPVAGASQDPSEQAAASLAGRVPELLHAKAQGIRRQQAPHISRELRLELERQLKPAAGGLVVEFVDLIRVRVRVRVRVYGL